MSKRKRIVAEGRGLIGGKPAPIRIDQTRRAGRPCNCTGIAMVRDDMCLECGGEVPQ